jgi:hypothetical protein
MLIFACEGTCVKGGIAPHITYSARYGIQTQATLILEEEFTLLTHSICDLLSLRAGMDVVESNGVSC